MLDRGGSSVFQSLLALWETILVASKLEFVLGEAAGTATNEVLRTGLVCGCSRQQRWGFQVLGSAAKAQFSKLWFGIGVPHW
ncbi:unnamed protein product [Microthlaspi erraticum]|uniref:Secreted protein n=1 Tax=Microthlaspi erraticum TaxID=1685480 RepID=A0A6D2IUZ7_9BRAS|nr:unnamed protein product [Microthlaspi erraticum]CAA7057958.1 unnamed protein product [Microthlaspi erraticum]